jgi:hypothetical protein
MARITTLEGLKNYVKIKLGHPVVCVQVTDEQLTQVIEDAIQTYQKIAAGIGNYETYLSFEISAGVPTYSLSGVESVCDLDFSFSDPNGINVLFSSQHNILYQDWVVFGNYPGGPGGGMNPGMALTTYEIANEYLEDIREQFQIIYYANYSKPRQQLTIIPTPKITGTGLIQVYKQEDAINLYNDDNLKKLCVALTKIQWATNFGPITMTLPGGGTIEKQELMTQGKEELEQIMETIRLESEPPVFFID